MIEPEIEIS